MIPHHSQSPNLMLFDFLVFPKLKMALKGRMFNIIIIIIIDGKKGSTTVSGTWPLLGFHDIHLKM
jgi:hypothetical protein